MSKKVLIINPSAFYISSFPENKQWVREQNFRPPLFMLYSYLKVHNIPSHIIDLELEIGHPSDEKELTQFKSLTKKILSELTFDVIAISCYTSMHYLSSLFVAKICRELNPNCTIVVGGNHPTAAPEDFLEGGLFDFIVKGEGEVALMEICSGHHGYKPSEPRIIDGTPLDLSRGVNLDWENCPYTQRKIERIGLSLSRGCPFRCSFCSESTIKMPAREYPIDLALRDIKKAVHIMKPKFLHIHDPLFRVDMPWGQDILNTFIKEDFQKPFYIFTRIDLLNEAQIKLLSKLNIHIWLGVETCSEKMLVAMNKTTNPKKYLAKIQENLFYLNEYEVMSDLGMIFNHPGETAETVEETFSFLERVFSKQRQVSVDFMPGDYFYLPGTLDSQNLDRFEKEFGAVVRYREWWKIPGDQHFFAKDIIPSYGLARKIEWQERFYKFWHECVELKVSKRVMLFRYWDTGVVGFPALPFVKEEAGV